ncbi:hypothetical protein [Clostridium guangxiense]|nr:hypothetical protein [Clostridium guangxiense]MCD2345872.1 hypothetical protein [Clostridium guangxiense]
MSNKLTTTKKKMASLGLKKNDRGDYDYIDPSEKSKSKYKSVKPKNKSEM